MKMYGIIRIKLDLGVSDLCRILEWSVHILVGIMVNEV